MDISLHDKLAGLLYGFAIGDALGLGTEFMTHRVMAKKYPNGLTNYSQIIRDGHRSQWERGEWSADTHYLLLLGESICQCGQPDPLHYASKLKEWFLTDPSDITTHLRWILSQEDFVDNPYEVAKRTWNMMRDSNAPSDSLGRALMTGIWNDNVEENALAFCRLTHPKSRCETASLIIANIANSLMWEDKALSYDNVMAMAKKGNGEMAEFVETARHGEIEDLHLDDPESCTFTRKAFGAALWSLWHCSSPDEALKIIVNEGGDADTNAALATGLMGLKFGVEAIDSKYIDGLVGKERIESLIDPLADLLQKRFVND